MFQLKLGLVLIILFALLAPPPPRPALDVLICAGYKETVSAWLVSLADPANQDGGDGLVEADQARCRYAWKQKPGASLLSVRLKMLEANYLLVE